MTISYSYTYQTIPIGYIYSHAVACACAEKTCYLLAHGIAMHAWHGLYIYIATLHDVVQLYCTSVASCLL